MALLIPEYLQTKKYAAQRVRSLLGDMFIQEGVLGPGDMLVAQRAAGANKSVDIAAGVAWIKGDFSSRQGLYHTFNDAVVNLTIPDNLTANPRLDQIICRINDTTDGGGVADSATFEVIQGTATAGATLDNRNGAAALPGSAVRIADVLAGASFTSITNSAIRDRRPWARGAYWYSESTVGDITGTNTTYNTTNTLFPGGSQRFEISSGLVAVGVEGTLRDSVANTVRIGASVDGVAPTVNIVSQDVAAVGIESFSAEQIQSVSAGSHLLNLGAREDSAGTWTVFRSTAVPLRVWVREILVPSTTNVL